MKKILTFILATLVISTLLFKGVYASTLGAYNIVTSLGADSSREMLVNYHSSNTGSVVEYTLNTDATFANKSTAISICRTFSVDQIISGGKTYGFTERYVCGASLNNLNPNTTYRYRVKEGTNYSSVYTFRTAPVSGSTNFMFLTDSQFYSLATAQAYNDLITEGLKLNPNIAFTMITGDITDRGGLEEQWNMFFQAGTNLNRMPMLTVPGNHEYYFDTGAYTSVDYYNAYFNNPKNGPDQYKNSTYFVKHNNALFVMIDVVTGQFRDQQIEWFSNVIENNPAKYIIVGMHYGGFGSTYANVAQQILNSWGLVFDKYQVDLVLSGHDHFFGVTPQVYNKIPSTIPGYGTTYIVGGAAGPKTYPVTEAARPNFNYTLVQPNIGSIISLRGQDIEVRLISSVGVVLQTFLIPTKRPTSIANITQEEFMQSILLEKDIENNTAKITWDGEIGYGNVKKIELLNNLNQVKRDIIVSMPIVTETSLGNIPLGTNHSYKLTVHFYEGDPIEWDLNFSQKYGSIEPTNLRVDSSSMMQDYVKLLWDEVVDMGELDYYKVFLNDVYIGNVEKGIMMYEFHELSKLTNYSARIEGIDTFGDVAYHKTITFQTNDNKFPWGNISSDTATPNFTSIDLNWTASLDLLGFGSYRIYVNDILRDTLTNQSTNYQITNLLENTNYVVKFVVIDKYGDEVYQTTFNTTTLLSKVPSGEIGSVEISESSIKHNAALLNWNKDNVLNGLDYYVIYLNGEEVGRPTKTANSYQFTKLSPNTQYNVKIEGIDLDGDVAFSSELMFQTADNTMIVGTIIGGSIVGTGGIGAGVMILLKRRKIV
jgi:chitodextrinase